MQLRNYEGSEKVFRLKLFQNHNELTAYKNGQGRVSSKGTSRGECERNIRTFLEHNSIGLKHTLIFLTSLAATFMFPDL